MVSYLAVWNQIQGWIQDFLIATGSVLQSVCVWGGGDGGFDLVIVLVIFS